MLPYPVSPLPFISLFLFVLDQISKKLIVWQNLSHQKNPSSLFFLYFSIILLFILFFWLAKAAKKSRHRLTLGLLLILTGGLSNLFDRLTTGLVVDWIFLPFFPFSVFNLADVYISLGLIFALSSFTNSNHYSR